jgi:hypothetical protein
LNRLAAGKPQDLLALLQWLYVQFSSVAKGGPSYDAIKEREAAIDRSKRLRAPTSEVKPPKGRGSAFTYNRSLSTNIGVENGSRLEKAGRIMIKVSTKFHSV